MKTISTLEFESRSYHSGNHCYVSGNGKVVVDYPTDSHITFSETGSWTADSGASLNFSNRYRWRRTPSERIIRLQHLRYGELRPVELVEFFLQPDASWESHSPHICKNDTYRATITLRADCLSLEWTISGPAKSQYIRCLYS